MELIEKYLVEKNGLEKVEKKTVVQFAIQNLIAISVSKSTKSIVASFPMFKNENTGSYRTHKENKQRDEFLRVINGDERIDTTKSAPVGKFGDEKEFIDFLKKNKIIKLCREYSEFREVNSDFTVSEEQLDGLTLKYRSSIPTEAEIMRDVFRNNEYVHKGLELSEKDVVLDLGANIGAFSCRNFRNVKKIIAFEPEDVNFEFLSINVNDNKAKNVETHKKAVVGNGDKTRDFYLGKVPYYYSFLVKNNRKRVPVECVNINDIMKKYKPTKMKVDIEGSEWEVLTNCKDFGNVNQLIFEYNFDMNGDLNGNFEHFDILTKHLKKHGFDTKQLEKYSRSKSWAEVFLCNRVIKK